MSPKKAKMRKGYTSAGDVKIIGKPTDIIIPVMGPTGAGKSTFVNALLREQRMKVGYKLTSCTSHLDPVIIEFDSFRAHKSLSGRRLVVVDTPGFDDTYEGDADILTRIADWLAACYHKNMTLGGVIYLHDISQHRFSGTARRNLHIFRLLCGDAALPKVVLGTTNWGRIDADTGDTREKELKAEHWESMISKGSVVSRFYLDENPETQKMAAWKLVDILLRQKVKDIALQIQKELVDDRKIVPQTAAGKELRYSLKEVLEMQRKMIAMEERLADTGDPEAQAKLQETQANMEKLLQQISSLKVSLPRKIRAFLGL